MIKRQKLVILPDNNNTEDVCYLKKDDFRERLLNGGISSILDTMEVPDEVLYEFRHDIQKSLLLNYNISENFINMCIEDGWIKPEDISEMTSGTYANLSDTFVKKYKNFINWSKYVLLMSIDDKIDQIDDSIIELAGNDENFWRIVSSNVLPKEFIIKWKDKINWEILSMINTFGSFDENEYVIAHEKIKEVRNKIENDALLSKTKFSHVGSEINITGIRRDINLAVFTENEEKDQKRSEIIKKMQELQDELKNI